MAVDTTPLIDGHVSVEQCERAVSALLRHAREAQKKADETELLPGKEQHVWLVMAVKRMQPMKNLKPQQIVIEHPLVDPRTTSICLITKDPQREYKDLLASHNINFISRVVGIQKLKGKFKGFDARRLLLRENGLFLADKRVLPLLPQLLGKIWFKAKKQPIPVTLTKKDLKGELEKAVSSTYMHQNKGTCTSIKIATISHKDSQVVSNLKAAIHGAVAHIHGGWDNVQSFNIKTSSSVSLPIWTCPLGGDEPGSRWEGMAADESELVGFGNGGNDAGNEVGQAMDHATPLGTQKTSLQSNGRKRTANPAGDAEDGATEIKKRRTSTASDMTSPKPPNIPEVKRKLSKKSRKLVDGDETASNTSRPNPTTRSTSPPISETLSADQPISTKRKKRHTSLKNSSSAPIPLKKSVTFEAVSEQVGPNKILEGTITGKERKQKKVSLGETKMEKKKGKLRETEKSVRKSAKAQFVGKLKA